tara:strand:+ start:489 stop:1199 length:711 start_codon:yes stop_codon:yes gene_type:complete
MEFSIIVQARMGSSRLPGKVLTEINGTTLFECLLKQISYCKSIDNVIVATTREKIDDLIFNKCRELDTTVFRGSELNVLDRFYQCAKKYSLKNIVRITADNPLIDPQIIDHVIDVYKKGQFDYVSNCETRTFPYGAEVEVFSYVALERAKNEALDNYELEHVTPYIRNKEKFNTFCLKRDEDLSHLRWTVDTKDDLLFIRKIYKRFTKKPILLEDILEILEKEPELLKYNTNLPKE